MSGSLVTVVVEFWKVLCLMAPYLLFGFLMAGILSVFISAELIERHLGGTGIVPVAKAALFGVPLPLCSCSVIPVAASLRNHGASRGATTGFLLSTPQTGMDSIFVTYGLLGPVFAIFRPIAAFLTGLIGGAFVDIFDGDDKADHEEAHTREDECDAEAAGNGKIARALTYGFVTLPKEIGPDLLVGLAIAGLISVLVPQDTLGRLLGGGIGTMVLMMLVGIPLYVCATASVPIAAALIAKGVSPGAAFVFLMTGPATNAATIMTIRKIMGWRTLLIYLTTVAGTALGWGVLLDRIFAIEVMPRIPQIHEMAPGWLGISSALVLLGVLGLGMWKRFSRPAPDLPPDTAESLALSIKGMTCEHCTETVRRALLGCQGVTSAIVNLKAGEATVGGDGLDSEQLRRAVEKAGYEVKET
ncbi:MAG: heavy metal-associated domain-containing protein [Planctomycetes bacterium]|nr:heavy metal-associated domain-containing protein [Planctomycetota bacterium]